VTIKKLLITSSLILLISIGLGCAEVTIPDVKMPRVSLPKLGTIGGDKNRAASEATPRDLLMARLSNPRANPNAPGMTVGKMIELADRHLACDCENTRFVRFWEKTKEGYRLYTSLETLQSIEFVCENTGETRQCYLLEIDRRSQGEALGHRFLSGSEFIQLQYDNGVNCERQTPCP